MMLLKCCTQYASKFGKLSSELDWKMSVFIPTAKKGKVKGCSNYWAVVLISHVSEVMLKILQTGLQQYMNQKFPYVQAEFSRLVLAAQWCLTFCDPMDWSLPGSPVHEILQARILEWVAIPFSRGSSRPRNWTQVSCIASKFFTIWATGKSL